MSLNILIKFKKEYEKEISNLISKIDYYKFKNKEYIKIIKERNCLSIYFEKGFNVEDFYIISMLSKMIAFDFSEKEFNYLFNVDMACYYLNKEKTYIIEEELYMKKYDLIKTPLFYSKTKNKVFITSESLNILKDEDIKNIDFFNFDCMPDKLNIIKYNRINNKNNFGFLSTLFNLIRELKYPFLLNKSKKLYYKMK